MVGVGSFVGLGSDPRWPPGHIESLATETLAQISAVASGEPRRVKIEYLVPFPLLAGMDVQVLYGESWQRGTIVAPDVARSHLRTFIVLVCGTTQIVDESELRRVERPNGTLEAFACLRWDHPRAAEARRALRGSLGAWYDDSEGLPTLSGSRVHPRVHQTYAAQRILTDHAPRFLLADEVGLGKTIEAGLVIQAMCSANPDTSVLVIAPGSMTRQWQCELYLRCGGHVFRPTSTAPDALEQPRTIVSASALAEAPGEWQQLAQRRWDLVVVDEAHHHPPGSSLYPLLRDLSEASRGILVLSATPSQGQLQGLVGLLALVAPGEYGPTDHARLQQRYDMRREVWDRLSFSIDLLEADEDEEDHDDLEALTHSAEEWEELLDSDPRVLELCREVRDGQAHAFNELVGYVQEHYRFDHRIIRTRRRTLVERSEPFPARSGERVEYAASANEHLLADHMRRLDHPRVVSPALQTVLRRSFVTTPAVFLERLTDRLEALGSHLDGDSGSLLLRLMMDPGPSEEADLFDEVLTGAPSFEGEADWLVSAIDHCRAWAGDGASCPRHRAAIDWVQEQLRVSPTSKFLIFAECRDVVEEFANRLGAVTGKTIERFTYCDFPEQEEAMREAADRFQRRRDRPVLVSDETGGEGRNFQVADAVLHLDGSWSIARMEQRVGRLDRLGREPERPVRSVYLVGPGEVDQAITTAHEDIFGVHKRSIGGLEFVLPELQSRLWEAACAGGQFVTDEFEGLTARVEDTLRDANEEYDQAYDTAVRELEGATVVNDARLESDADAEDRQHDVCRWARAMDVNIRRLDEPEGAVRFKWSELRAPIPGLSAEGKYVGTFSREVAMEHENVHFFAPGHRVVDSLVRSLDIPDIAVGRCSAFARRLRKHRGRLFLVGSIACRLDQDCALPAGLLTRALRRLSPSSFEFTFELLLSPDPAAEPVTGSLRHELLEDFTRADQVLAPQDLEQVAPIGALRLAVDLAVEAGFALLGPQRADAVAEARGELEKDLANELAFLGGVVARKEPGYVDVGRQIAERLRLLEAVEEESQFLDSLTLIWGA